MYKQRLKEYIEEDKIYQKYKLGVFPESDFDEFCIELCKDIEDLLNENEFLKLSNPEQNIEHFRIIKENKRKIDNLRKENKELHNKIDKIRELVENSEWRLDDVHDLIDGYNEIEEILKDSDVDD